MNIQKNLQLAFQLFNQKNYDHAIITLNKILKKDPNHPLALSNKGLILLASGRKNEAIEFFKKSLQYKFDLKVMLNLITLFMELNIWDQAKYYNSKLIDYKDHPQILLNSALILRNEGKFEESLDIYSGLIEKFPENLDLYISKGFVLNQLSRYAEAIIVYKEALSKNKNYYSAIYNLGITLNNDQNFKESIIYLKKALEYKPENVDGWLTLAAAQVSENLMKDARVSIDKAASVDNYQNKDVLIEAKFQSALVELNDTANYREAERLFNEILEQQPDHVETNFHMGISYLKQNKYEGVSKYYRYRTLRKKRYGRYDDFDLPSINKDTKLLVGGEQGIGDNIILVRLLPFLRQKVADVKYGSYTKLAKFLKYNFDDKFDIVDEDYLKETESTEFANYTKLNLFSIINYLEDVKKLIPKIPLMKCDPSLKKRYEKKYKKEGKKLIGLSWKSGVEKIGKIKSFELDNLKCILEDSEKYTFVNLQYGNVTEEVNELNKNKKINIQIDNKLDYFDDMYSLAALVAACDVIITCSNVTAHIAGCLGVKTYVLLPQKNAKLWYWFNKKDGKSIWYPSVSLIDQTTYRDWNEPVKQIIKELDKYKN
jgi:tetratricopeptide (TPR) repeat protein